MESDVLKPDLLWIGKRCYRKIPLSGVKLTSPDTDDLYPGEYQKPYEEKHGITIKHQNNLFHNIILAPSVLESNLRILSRSLEHKILKSEAVRITVPRSCNKDGNLEITIRGPTERGAYEASRKIEEAIEIARVRSPSTHFISVPMNSDVLQNSFVEFQANVMKTCGGARGLDESLFQDPCKLHMTILMLNLMDSHECESAVATLKNCRENIISMLYGNPLTVMVRGVEIMNDDPEEVDVLYAKIESDEDGCLERITDYLIKEFGEAKLSSKLEPSVKLHITLMNSLFRANSEGRREREKFDASSILKEFDNFKFGKVTISQVHVSTLHGRGEDGYYIPLCSITIDNKKIYD